MSEGMSVMTKMQHAIDAEFGSLFDLQGDIKTQRYGACRLGVTPRSTLASFPWSTVDISSL